MTAKNPDLSSELPHPQQCSRLLPDHLWSTQPAVLVAMLLTLANDRVLKGAAVLPSTVTGKLSDFCGLFFTPFTLLDILLIVTAPFRNRYRFQRYAFLVILCTTHLTFCLIKLFPLAAQTYKNFILSTFSLNVLVTPDLTDLFAVVTLPLSLAYFLEKSSTSPIHIRKKILSPRWLILIAASPWWTHVVARAEAAPLTEITQKHEASETRLFNGAVGTTGGYLFHDFAPDNEAQQILPQSSKMNHAGWFAGLRTLFFTDTGSSWFGNTFSADLRYLTLESTKSYSGGKITLQQKIISLSPSYRPTLRLGSGIGLFIEVGPEIKLVDSRLDTPSGSQPISKKIKFGAATSLGVQAELLRNIVSDIFVIPYPKPGCGLGVYHAF